MDAETSRSNSGKSPDGVCPELAGTVPDEPGSVVAGVRTWVERQGSVLARHRPPRAAELSEVVESGRDLQHLLWDEGWMRLGWPVDCGGLGGGPLLRAAVYEGLTSSGLVLPETFPGIETLGNMVARFAPDLARSMLRPFIRGESIWCQGFSEPEAGSDLGSLRTTLTAEAGDLTVNGHKVWTTLAPFADYMLTLVRCDQDSSNYKGLAVVMIDLHAPGVLVTPLPAATGQVEFAQVTLTDVTVTEAALVGQMGGGWDVAMVGLQWERGMYAWQRQGWMHSLLDQLLRGATDRPLDANHLAETFEGLTALRLSARETLRLLAAGVDPGPRISVDKILLSTVEQQLLDLTRDTLAGDLDLNDDAVAASLRHDYAYSRAAPVYGGTAEIQRNIIAERLLGLPREVRVG
jgi:acyl-CoA dehydrogenase